MKTSQQGLSICGNSFKTFGKAFQVKLVIKSVQSCHQGVATLKNQKYKIDFDLFNTLRYYMIPYVCYLVVLMSSLLFYNVENSKYKELHLNE